MRYMPPEQLNGSLSFKTDIWGFACLLLQFATGHKPFNDVENEIAASIKVVQGESPLDYALNNFDDDSLYLINKHAKFREILADCFNIDYKQRPTAQELFSNPFFEDYTS